MAVKVKKGRLDGSETRTWDKSEWARRRERNHLQVNQKRKLQLLYDIKKTGCASKGEANDCLVGEESPKRERNVD